MSYLEELLPEFRNGAKIRRKNFCWEYIYFENNTIWNKDGELVSICGDDVYADNWELYQEPQPDWDYIIKNKCLCWFWEKEETIGNYGILSEVVNCNSSPFIKNFGAISCDYKHCRPVGKDEVTFYEDKE